MGLEVIVGRRPLRNSGVRAASTGTARQEALAGMNAALRKKIARIERMISDTREATIRFYYHLGKEVRDIRHNPDGIYGERPLQQLEKVFGTTKRTLYKACTFAEVYSEAQVEALIALENTESGFRLNYQHVVYLLGLPTAALRDQFARRAVAESWEPKELMRAIQRYCGRSRVGAANRRHKLPTGLQQQLQQILDVTRTWHSKYIQLWADDSENSVLTSVLAEADEHLTAVMLDILLAVQDLLPTVEQELHDIQQPVARAIEHIGYVLERRAVAEAAAAQSERAAATASDQSVEPSAGQSTTPDTITHVQTDDSVIDHGGRVSERSASSRRGRRRIDLETEGTESQ